MIFSIGDDTITEKMFSLRRICGREQFFNKNTGIVKPTIIAHII